MQNNYSASTKEYFDIFDLFQKYVDSKMFILIDETKTRYFNVEHGAAKSNKINSSLKRMTQNLLMTFFAIEKSS